MIGGARIYNVHCKDNDMYSRGNIPAGCGITDYTEVIRALKAVEYHGNLTVELEFTDMPTRYNRQAYEHIVKCLKGEY
jgi:sugar phosphate isomerase/epimerase